MTFGRSQDAECVSRLYPRILRGKRFDQEMSVENGDRFSSHTTLFYDQPSMPFRKTAVDHGAAANCVDRHIGIEFLFCHLVVQSDVIATEAFRRVDGIFLCIRRHVYPECQGSRTIHCMIYRLREHECRFGRTSGKEEREHKRGESRCLWHCAYA